MEPAVAIAGVTKDFPFQLGRIPLRALDDVSFTVAQGEVVGLLGPNGSGKSTLLKILLGLLAPSAGACRLFGVSCDSPQARARVGFLAESAEFPRFLTARELVVQAGRLGGMNAAAAATRADELLAWAGLAADADRRLGAFSKGMRQRAGLAQALVHDPALVILDEPTTGLDPVGVAEFGALVRDLKARGTTVLLCSHHLEQVEELCARVVVLHRGRVVGEETIAELCGPRRLEAFPAGGALGRRFLALVQSASAGEVCPVALRVSSGTSGSRSDGSVELDERAESLPRTFSTDSTEAAAAPAARPVPALTRGARGRLLPAVLAGAGAALPVAGRVSGATAGRSAWPTSLARIRLVGALTLRDAVRQRAPYVILLLALALVAGAQVLRGFNFGGSELKFLGELGLGAVSLFGSALAVIVMTHLFAGELERGGGVWLLAKPVRRAEYVAGKFLGAWAGLALFVATLVALLGLQLAARGHELGAPVRGFALPLIAAALSLTLKLGVVAALALLLCTWLRGPLLALTAGFLVVAACHLQPVAQHVWRHADSAVVRGAGQALALVLPDLQAFEPELSPDATTGFSTGHFLALGAYGAVYVVVFLGCAGVFFRRREL